jgi:hypothetical protein
VAAARSAPELKAAAADTAEFLQAAVAHLTASLEAGGLLRAPHWTDVESPN